MAEDELLQRVMDANYDTFLQAGKAVLLFKIASCKPCDEFEPIVRKAAELYHPTVRFGKVLMHVPGTCIGIKKRYTFETFPTTHFYKNGQLVQIVEGKLDEKELNRLIETQLSSAK
jgi:thioredoxin-like negative regulator of GroEL